MMRLTIILLLVIMLCSLGACSPVSEIPAKSASPTTIFHMASFTPIKDTTTPAPTAMSHEIPTQTLALQIGTEVPAVTAESSMAVTQSITITIIYDNHLYDQRLGTAWGFSALVEYGDNTLLFDTGGDGGLLMGNMNILEIDPLKIDNIVLSHAHEDHTGGLLTLLDAGARPVVHLLPSFPPVFKHQVEQYTEVNEVSPWETISEGIWTTGELGGTIPEQALVVDTAQGLIVITGCAHQGIIKIIEQVHDTYQAPLDLVLGGFHLGSKSRAEILAIVEDFRRFEVERVAPSHCTGDQAINMFAAEYGDKYLSVGAGSVIRLEALPLK